jgi:arginyl-tRNA--protein-N-Asp/Glu arginylyltransferase
MDPKAIHEALSRRLREILERGSLGPEETFACPYLPGRSARRVLVAAPAVPGLYHALMDANFRRLGPLFYKPLCDGCAECRMLRVPVADFAPSRSQRRCLSRNADLSVTIGSPEPTPEKHALYQRYLDARHDGQMDGSLEEFERFLYASPVDSAEVVFRLGERIVAVGIVDREPLAWSAVYCYFEPDLPGRSLGVLNVLTLVGECRRRGVPHLYLGYYVRECAAMVYKASFRPCELLSAGGAFERTD